MLLFLTKEEVINVSNEQEMIMQSLDDEFGDTKTYEWKVAICHFVTYYNNQVETIKREGIIHIPPNNYSKGGD